MRKRKGTRLFAGILAGALLFTGFAQTGIAYAALGEHAGISAKLRNEGEDAVSSLSEAEKDKEVRVIVELQKDSVLEEVNEKKLNFKTLDPTFLSEKKEELKKERENVLAEIEEKGIETDTSGRRSYDTVLNGIALQIRAKDIHELEEIRGVKSVYIAEEFERPLLTTSHEMVGANFAWNTGGYKGEGRTVAVIDTGIDFNHQAMKIEDEKRAKHSRESMERLIGEKNLPGRFYSSKVPYGYNYYDHNENLFDSYGSMHGMHVSGIAGANDTEKNIFGVAPNAQILALKVFSDDVKYPTTFTDVWLKALDDAVKLGADSVNMSLGSPAGFSIEGRHFPETEIIEKARKAGISVVVAAGNEGKLTDGNTYRVKALSGNSDTALVANPSLDEGTLSVASFENDMRYFATLSAEEIPGIKRKVKANVVRGTEDKGEKISGKWIEVTEKTIAKENIEAEIRGNMAVLKLYSNEGEREAFLKRVKAVAEATPSAIILYNDGDFTRTIRPEGEAKKFTIARISQADYLFFNRLNQRSIRRKKTPIDMEIGTELSPYPNPNQGKMSGFSSWGPTPDLRIKPEITAPGGGIYSTVEDGNYQNMSGTSMASPHVAGAVAIIRQYMEAEKINAGEDVSGFVKLLLMNTARPMTDLSSPDRAPYFVRQQGSGLMDLENAIKTKVVVTAEGTNDTLPDGKLELKELSEPKFRVKLTLRNFGSEDKSYTVHAKGIYERILNGERSEIPGLLSEAEAGERGQVIVKAGQTAVKEFELDYSGSDELKENNYLEGFIELGEEGGETSLTVPFLGFYGDWGSGRAIDAFSLKEVGENETRPVQFYVNKAENIPSSLFVTGAMLPLPVVRDTLYFSPSSTYYKSFLARIAPLRNMESITYEILDGETGKVLRTLGKSLNVRKLNRLHVKNSFVPMSDSFWDGRLDGVFAEDGKEYLYRMTVKLNTNGTTKNDTQVYRFKVKTDGKGPEILGTPSVRPAKASEIPADHRLEGKQRLKFITIRAKDDGTGLEDIYVNSVKYVKNTPNLPPRRDLTPPGVSTPPGDKKTEPPAPGVPKKEEGTNGAPKYGKYLRVCLTDKEMTDGIVLAKIENGKVEIPVSALPGGLNENKTIYVNRNGHPKNEEVEMTLPYVADTTHLYISAKDYLRNKTDTTVPTGERESFNSVDFLNFASFKEHNVKVEVDGKILENYSYSTRGSKAEISVTMPDDQKHLSFLSIKRGRKTTFLLKGGKPEPEAADYRYSYDRANRTVHFTIDKITSQCEVVTAFQNGPMPEEPKLTELTLDLSGMGLHQYKSIKADRKGIAVPEDGKLKIMSGKRVLEFLFKDEEKGKKVLAVLVHKKNGTVKLSQASSMMIDTGEEGFSSNPNFSVKLCTTFLEDARIEAIFEGTKEAKRLTPFGNDLADDGYTKINSAKTKYPVVYLEFPSLLQMLPEEKDHFVHIEGFIGNVKPDDRVKKIEIMMVDEEGKQLGEKAVFTGDEIKKEVRTTEIGGAGLYKGDGYGFNTKLKAMRYAVNLRIEATTEKGHKASITRRAFYDFEDPVISYEVKERNLSSDTATLSLHITDDSLKLKVYHGDSLIDTVDKTGYTLSKNGTELKKELTVDLKKGQNKILLKAVDLTGYKTEKEVYIYRTE